jgi:hypothetical protein
MLQQGPTTGWEIAHVPSKSFQELPSRRKDQTQGIQSFQIEPARAMSNPGLRTNQDEKVPSQFNYTAMMNMDQ